MQALRCVLRVSEMISIELLAGAKWPLLLTEEMTSPESLPRSPGGKMTSPPRERKLRGVKKIPDIVLTSFVARDLRRRFDLSRICERLSFSLRSCVASLHFLHPKDVERTIEDGRIVKHDDATVRPWLDVQSAAFAVLIILTAEVVAYSLHRHTEVISYAMNSAIRQTILD